MELNFASFPSSFFLPFLFLQYDAHGAKEKVNVGTVATGSASGAGVGAGIGAVVGSIVPGPGTALGALVGTGVGAVYGVVTSFSVGGTPPKED